MLSIDNTPHQPMILSSLLKKAIVFLSYYIFLLLTILAHRSHIIFFCQDILLLINWIPVILHTVTKISPIFFQVFHTSLYADFGIKTIWYV